VSHMLVTGGAGFIGSHIVDALIARRHEVRALDSLVEQVHGPKPKRPAHLHRAAKFVRGIGIHTSPESPARDRYAHFFTLAQ